MLSQRLIEEKSLDFKGGIYHKVQIELAYNSSHIEGSQLSHDQTRYIFETNTIGFEEGTSIKVDDIIKVSNYFTSFHYLIDSFQYELTEKWIKEIHTILKRGHPMQENHAFLLDTCLFAQDRFKNYLEYFRIEY